MFVVYENFRHNYCMIHSSKCQEYLTRKANTTYNAKGQRVGTWHGPYSTYQEAKRRGTKPGKRLDNCSKCISRDLVNIL